jgi:hypothetical protein
MPPKDISFGKLKRVCMSKTSYYAEVFSPVCNDDSSSANHHTVQCILNNTLRFGVQGTGGLIQ